MVVDDVNSSRSRRKYEDLLIELGLYSIDRLREDEYYCRMSKRDLIANTLREPDGLAILRAMAERRWLHAGTINALELEGIEPSPESPVPTTEALPSTETKQQRSPYTPGAPKSATTVTKVPRLKRKKKTDTRTKTAIVVAIVTGLFLIVTTIISAIIGPIIVHKITAAPTSTTDYSPTLSPAREADALYQRETIVARVSGVTVEESQAMILFQEIYNSNLLDLASEFEFQDWRLQFHGAEAIIGLDTSQPDKGRIITNAICEIIGSRSQ
jgi:hypothetical protein